MTRLFGAASTRWGLMNKNDERYTEAQIIALIGFHREFVEMRSGDRGPAFAGAAATPAAPAVDTRTPIEE
eukprot:4924796-Alexandrium_andersonii.AAC.1